MDLIKSGVAQAIQDSGYDRDTDGDFRSYLNNLGLDVSLVVEPFTEKSPFDKTDAVIRLREAFNLGIRPVPLSLIVAYGETVLTDNSEDSGAYEEYYQEIFRHGQVNDILRQKLRFDNEVEKRDVRFYIDNQSPDLHRSIVELTSNAIDFSENDKEVIVETSENGFKVRDFGRGMSPKDLIEKLNIPNISGARAADVASIGKFGMGFFTSLSHLKADGDKVTVKTGFNGVGYQLEYIFVGDEDEGEIMVIPSIQEGDDLVLQGTEVEIKVKDFEKDEADYLLHSYLKYKEGSTILHNGKVVNDLSDFNTLSSGRSLKDKSSLKWKDKTSSDVFVGEVGILINGVLIEKLFINGTNLPVEFVVDLPYTTDLPESRDKINYDLGVQGVIKQLISDLNQIDELGTEQFVAVANALALVIDNLEKRNVSNGNEENLIDYVGGLVQARLEEDGLIAIPDTRGLEVLAIPAGIQVTSILGLDDLLKIKEITRCPTFQSSTHKAYIADFKGDVEVPLVVSGNKVFINREVYEKHKSNPVLLDLYLNLGRQNNPIGTILRTDRLYVKRDNTQKDIRDTLVQNMEDVLDFGEIHQRDLARIMFNSNSGWGHNVNHYKALSDYILGKTDTIETDTELDMPDHYKIYFERYLELVESQDDMFVLLREAYPKFDLEELAYLIRDEDSESRVEFIFNQIKKFYQEPFRRFIAGSLVETYDPLTVQDIETKVEFLNHFFENIRLNHKGQKNWEPDKQADYFIPIFIFGMYDSIWKRLEFSNRVLELVESDGEVGELIEKFQSIISLRMYSFDTIENLANADPRIALDFYDKHISRLKDYPFIRSEDLLSLLYTKYNFENTFLNQGQDRRNNDSIFSDESLEQIYLKNLTLTERERARSEDPFTGRLFAETFSRWLTKANLNEIHSLEELKIVLSEKKERFDEKLNIGLENICSILELPMVSGLIEYISDDLQRFFEERTSLGYIQFNLLNFWDFFNNIDSYGVKLTEAKLKTIDNFVAENFRPDELGELEYATFTLYLKRCLQFADLSDEDFEYIQPALTSLLDFEKESEYGNKISLFSRNIIDHTPKAIFNAGVIAKLRDLEIEPQFAGDFFRFFNSLLSDQSTLEVSNSIVVSYEEMLDRGVEIWADISKKPYSEYSKLQRYFGLTTYKEIPDDFFRRSETKSYGFFKHKFDPSEIPEEIRPYVIHFIKGGLDFRLASEEKFQEQYTSSLELESYGNEIRLSNLTLAKKLNSKTYTKLLQDEESFNYWLNFGKDGRPPYEGKNNIVTKRNLLHAVFHQSNTADIFLREVIQNSLDAANNSENNVVRELNIDEFIFGESHVLQLRDFVGMDFETVMGYLLLPEYSSKAEGSVGKFGIGFLNILKDADKVLIQTKSRSGKVVNLCITPVIDENESIIDFNLSYETREDEDLMQGTVIQRFTKASKTSLTSAFIEDRIIKYGTYVDSAELKISFNGDPLNYEVATIATSNIEGYGEIRLKTGAGKVMTQSGIYVKEFDTNLLPATLAKYSEDLGFVLELSSKIPLTRSRHDIARKQKVMPAIGSVLPKLALENLIYRYSAGEFDYDQLPYDFYTDDYGINSSVLKILNDVEALVNIGYLEDYDDYLGENAEENIFYLLVNLPSVNYKGSKISLKELASIVRRGDEIDWDELPSNLGRKLKEAKTKIDTRIRNRARASGDPSYREYEDFEVTDRVTELLNSRNAKIITKLINFSKLVTSPRLKGKLKHTLYYKENDTLAHAFISQGFKGWNLKVIGTLFEKFSIMIANGSNTYNLRNSKNMNVLYQLLEISTHEDAHFLENSIHNGYTHNASFYQHQKSVVAELIRTLDIDELLTTLHDPSSTDYYGSLSDLLAEIHDSA